MSVLLFLLTESIWLSGLCVKGRVIFILLSVLLFLLTESIWLSGLCVKEGSFNCIVCPALPYLVILWTSCNKSVLVPYIKACVT